MRLLEESPGSESGLAQRLVARLGLDTAPDLTSRVPELMERLVAAGLIERAGP